LLSLFLVIWSSKRTRVIDVLLILRDATFNNNFN